jgi:pyruvate kinase
MTEKIKAITTIPPYAPYIVEVLKHPIVSGIRLNTVMPVKESYEELLKRLNEQAKSFGKDLWIDLKCRQLRVKTFGVPPFTEIVLSHELEVYTPCKAYFSERDEVATVLEVDGNRLIMQEGPRRVVGPGESVTIIHPTLKIKGYLTDKDKEYIEAGNKVGINKYMLSFVENPEDITEFRKYNANASVVAKIESKKGLDYVTQKYNGDCRLMAARGDLFMQVHWPHLIIDGLEKILEKDKDAIVASRIFKSLAKGPEPTCEEIGDVDNLLRMGYRTVMLGDDVCQERTPVISALNLFLAIAEKYQRSYAK